VRKPDGGSNIPITAKVILLPLINVFLFFFVLIQKRNPEFRYARRGTAKKIKANPNASGRFARQRHVTSLLLKNHFTGYTVFQYFLNSNQLNYH
jgi:hypothetical protein